jgi:hypothetical protein
MNGQCYEVRQFASRQRCDMPGYFQYFEALDEEGQLLYTISQPSEPGAKNDRVFIRSQKVWARSAPGAVRRFIVWKKTGKPLGWLLDPNFAEAAK